MPTPVTIVDSGGLGVTNTTLGAPFTPVESGGFPITLLDAGGFPMALVNDDLSAWPEGGLLTRAGDSILDRSGNYIVETR